ncbi:C40 family peptidase [Enterobacter sp. A103]|uniref:C40 family peptidase n=1 Tax=Enterobacter sp. A103 TaxID=3102785 RepID=UPI002ACB01B1|nr:Mov34/MPN/PAD-1 family protein [Enterobacter sp. A103]MDZ5641663.1 NlpC/P60 family protein [Enterobacter sp. A103]
MTPAEQHILAHAAACSPQEACGLVITTPAGEQYFPCENRHPDPTQFFEILPDDWLRAAAAGDITAVVHSHPEGPSTLSVADRQAQRRTELPWWLVCDGRITVWRNIPPLTGRTFEHGVTDCYTLFRDAYALAGIQLPDFVREDDWWRHGQNLYLDNLPSIGLYRVMTPQPGDIILCCYGGSVANHAAVYCGDQHILHHLPHQLSKREVYNHSWQRMTHSFWRHREWQPLSFTAICSDLAAASACR